MNLSDVPLITRREIEARILAPFVQALCAEFDPDQVRRNLAETIQRLAREQGAAMAQQLGGDSLAHLERVVELWKQGDALQLKVMAADEGQLAFDVTYCAYAEMYRRLGIADLGATLSCQRDRAFIEGFNPRIRLERSQTLMEGGACCDFRYRLQDDEEGA